MPTQRFNNYQRGANRPLNGERFGDSRLEWVLGCSGTHHARLTERVEVVNDEGVPFVQHSRTQKDIKVTTKGPCDGSCTGRQGGGHFFAEVDSVGDS